MEQTPSFDPTVPSIARTYDYLLGGKDHYPVDREIGEIFFKKFPGAVQIALDNRACLVRAVTFMAGELGISQFLDLGSGLPTADNVHQVAQRANPGARVLYVDNDPIVLAHGRAMLAEDEHTVVVRADIRQPQQILSEPAVRNLIDFDRPVAVIASAVLHHLLDEEDPLGAIRTLRDATAPGSCLFVSHFRTLDDPDSAALEAVMLEAFGRGVWRTDEQIAQFFGDMRPVAPGIVPCARWRHDADPGELSLYRRLIVAGLGQK
ncbi:MAG TPA: SAM-dependent methyltransferase [Trebonia sp.]